MENLISESMTLYENALSIKKKVIPFLNHKSIKREEN